MRVTSIGHRVLFTSPDLVLTAGPSSTPSTPVDAGTQVTLSWGTDGTATSCTASGGTAGDGWNGDSWTARTTSTPLPIVNNTASVVVTPNVTTIYTVACTGTKGLVSTANVTVYIAQPANGVCGSTVNRQACYPRRPRAANSLRYRHTYGGKRQRPVDLDVSGCQRRN